MDYQVRTIWNVIATIPGTVEPDRWVMIGNHRDAWVYGAVDPGSGTAATMEMCRALGAAVKNGWKPRRTLLYASWDAEEYGLVGSTEWAEQNASSINEKAVLLLNVDSAVSGPEFGGQRRSLVARACARRRRRDHRPANRQVAPLGLDRSPSCDLGGQRAACPRGPALGCASHGRFSRRIASTRTRGFFPQLGSLGSGSDFTAFLDHLAVPAIDVGFHGGYGVYHSIYDDFNWMEKFGDPEFLTHATAARFYTLIAMRAAAADIVPLKFVPYGVALREHVDELRLIHAQRVRKADPAKTDLEPEFAGLRSLVEAVRGVSGSGRGARPGHPGGFGTRPGGSRRAGEAERLARAGGAGVSARKGPAGPPLVQACRSTRPA